MSAVAERTFTDSPAVRSKVPLLIGLVAPSGGGKTKSALRLAEGIQRICGGDIFGIDSEANRMLHYAEQHKFRHVPFRPPFDALSYLAAVKHCVARGAKTVIIDSASHLHEGPGGTLEMHEEECQRLIKAWGVTRDKAQMSAWQKPKQELRRFLNEVLQMDVNTIWCYRAKDKLKIVPGKQPQPMGFMPIAGDEMVYEMTLNMLLYPNSGGVPSWHPEEMGERAIVKLPTQFRDLFAKTRPLDEDIGEQLAKWAAGGMPSDPVAELVADYAKCGQASDLKALDDRRKKLWTKSVSPTLKEQMKEAADAAAKRLAQPSTPAASGSSEPPDIAACIETLRLAMNREELQQAWDLINEQLAMVPLEIDAFYQQRKEALAQPF